MIQKKILILGLIIGLFSSCAEEKTPGLAGEGPLTFEIIQISTSLGDMYAYLYNETPLHHSNFTTLAKEGFYDSTEFHRIVTNFVIQGGDPNSKDSDRSNDGSGSPGYTIPAEIDSAKFKHSYGAMGAARSGNATNPLRASNGSQFYIVTDENGESFLDGEYTVFGELVKGWDVAKSIEKKPKNADGLPLDRISMTVEVHQYTQEVLDAMDIVIPKH
jgi:cyclophilin family peptidyl-prolyl cis-trans isomerase